MNVSTSVNSYQNMNVYQQQRDATILPIVNPIAPPPERPTTEYSPGEVYKASDGNAIADRDGNLYLTPQGKLNISKAKQAEAETAAAEAQAKKDAIRGTFVDYVGYQSKKSQVEIYLSVATDSDVEIGSDIKLTLESLRDIQKQNNTVQAYAQYQENQLGAANPL
ncbi:hypothetical protein MNB_SM-6-480 [hydrothermal vent metagenome]|uniref:Uncharacterized protein n=1 Tax=hydrothermal vent metagenome TaxID=652676 RepID=A0A1W1CDA2_9ZZZZ